MMHKDALEQLDPLNLGGLSPAELYAVGKGLDELTSDINVTLREFFADTCEDTIDMWEARYGIRPSADASIADRRSALVSRRRQRGGCSKAYYVKLATGLGYTISITPHADGMRLPATLPATMYDAGEICRWTITVFGVASAPDLEELFNKIKRAHTTVEFIYA
jgi:uncharacterized protein YmfQ (DUF2313 family)